MPKDPSIKQLLMISVRAQSALAKQATETNKLIKQQLAMSGGLGAGARQPRAPAQRPNGNAGRGARQAGPAVLPLDGLSRGLFGPGFRCKVVKVVSAAWFKSVGVTSTGPLPYNKSAPLAMAAVGRNPSDVSERSDFDLEYKGELSRVVSKVKLQMSGIMVDQLLTLYQLPSIVDPGSANPPNLPAHKAPFKVLREPPAAFDANDPRYKYFMSWMAGLDGNELKAFQTPQCRKLLEKDFFARCEAKGLLPPSAQKWNLGSLAYFLLFIMQRLQVKRGASGQDVYGNLKDGSDAIAEVERICAWLMDPIACPTTWPVLLTIRQENPHYGVAPPAVA